MTKAQQTALEIAKTHNIDFRIALQITQKIYEGARQALCEIIGSYGADGWQRLTQQEKARVCTEVVLNLLDKERVAAFVQGQQKSLI